MYPPEEADFSKVGGRIRKDRVSGELLVDIRSWHPSREWRNRLIGGLGKLTNVRSLKCSSLVGEYVDDLVASIGDSSALQELDLEGSRLTNHGLRTIRSFTKLRTLNLSRTPITDHGLAHLATLPQLSTLSLRATRVTAGGLAHLAGVRALEELDVSYTNLNDDALTMLGRLAKLRSLSLADTLISDLSIEPLAQLANLSSVELQGSLVTAQAVEGLQSRRPELRAKWAPSLMLIGYWAPDRWAHMWAGRLLSEVGWVLRRAYGNLFGNSEEESYIIHPRRLVDRGWRIGERPWIVRYLSDAPVVAAYCGMSYCRFGCGWNGSAEKSDGVWIWPEGLAHYVQCHSVRLPDDLLSHMRGRGFRPSVSVSQTSTRPAVSSAYWRYWAGLQLGCHAR
jgi:hypothetical protein